MSTGPADGVLDTFKSLVFDPLVKGVIQKIIGSAAWLAWGPVAFLVTKIVTIVADEIYKVLKLQINFGVILFNNELMHKQYVVSAKNIREIAKTKGIDSPEFREARDEHKKALAKFVRYSGT